jgi:hypothetical protein
MMVHNLLSLLHLPIRHTKGKEPLIDYFQAHVVTSSKYLGILGRKTMEKIVAKEIKASKRKEKEDR